MILKILVFFIYFNLELETSFNTDENNPFANNRLMSVWYESTNK